MSDQNPRRILGIFGLAALAIVLVIGIRGVVEQLNTPVTIVKIDGNLESEQQVQVRKLLANELSKGFIGMNLEYLIGHLNKVSWVRSAETRREWPNTLHLTVHRQALVARWNDHSYLNYSGDIVSGGRKPVDGLPKFECRNADGERAMYIYQMFNQLLEPTGLTIASLMENELGEWSLQFDTGMVLALGSDQLLPRMERFVVVYQQKLAEQMTTVDSVDARYVNGIAVHWGGGSEERKGQLIASNRFISGGSLKGN